MDVAQLQITDVIFCPKYSKVKEDGIYSICMRKGVKVDGRGAITDHRCHILPKI